MNILIKNRCTTTAILMPCGTLRIAKPLAVFHGPIFFRITIQSKRIKSESYPSAKAKSIFTIIQNRPNIQSGEIAEKLAIPAPTVKRILAELLKKGLIEKEGNGRSVSYTVK
jgi:DNA-binding MarR family transcriptional regulator